MPVVKRKYLPYNTMEDFINAQITQINFPGINASPVGQTIGPYNIQKRPGFSVDSTGINKQITLSIKNTESYIAYFVLRDQMNYFLKIGEQARVGMGQLFMPDIIVSLLDDGGFETACYVLKHLTMTSLSDLNLQYSAQIGQFNTFTASFVYSFYDVYTVDENGRKLISEPVFPQKDFNKKYLDSDNEKYNPIRQEIVSTKQNMNGAAPILRSRRNFTVSNTIDPTMPI